MNNTAALGDWESQIALAEALWNQDALEALDALCQEALGFELKPAQARELKDRLQTSNGKRKDVTRLHPGHVLRAASQARQEGSWALQKPEPKGVKTFVLAVSLENVVAIDVGVGSGSTPSSVWKDDIQRWDARYPEALHTTSLAWGQQDGRIHLPHTPLPGGASQHPPELQRVLDAWETSDTELERFRNVLAEVSGWPAPQHVEHIASLLDRLPDEARNAHPDFPPTSWARRFVRHVDMGTPGVMSLVRALEPETLTRLTLHNSVEYPDSVLNPPAFQGLEGLILEGEQGYAQLQPEWTAQLAALPWVAELKHLALHNHRPLKFSRLLGVMPWLASLEVENTLLHPMHFQTLEFAPITRLHLHRVHNLSELTPAFHEALPMWSLHHLSLDVRDLDPQEIAALFEGAHLAQLQSLELYVPSAAYTEDRLRSLLSAPQLNTLEIRR